MAMVSFIGAGPGDPELLTLKGARRIAAADLVLYAGSLVPRECLAGAKAGARLVDSAPLSLEQTHALMVDTVGGGGLVARVHTGDPALYGAVREQIALLERDAIPWEIVPGVTAAFATAAMAGVGFTVPEAVQSVVFTRLPGRTPMPPGESLERLAAIGCSLAVYLSAGLVEDLRAALLAGGLAPETPVVIGQRVGWPDGRVLRTTVDQVAAVTTREKIGRQAVFLILPGELAGAARSRLYDAGFGHGHRPAEGAEPE